MSRTLYADRTDAADKGAGLMRQLNLSHYIAQIWSHQDPQRTRLNTQIWPTSTARGAV